MRHELIPTEQAILQAAATIFASVHDRKALEAAEASEARRYALTQAQLLAMAVEELRKERY